VIEIKAVIIAVGAALVIGAGAGGYAAWQYRAMKADNDLLDLRNTFDSATAAAKEQSLGVERELQAQINQVSQKGRDENQKIESNAAVAASTAGNTDTRPRRGSNLGRVSVFPAAWRISAPGRRVGKRS